MRKKYLYGLGMLIFLIILIGGLHYYQQSFNVALRKFGFKVESFILVDNQSIVHEANASWSNPQVGIARIKETGEAVWIHGTQPVNLTPTPSLDAILNLPTILRRGLRSTWTLQIIGLHDEEGRSAWIQWEEFNDEWNTYPANIYFDEGLKNYHVALWGPGIIWNMASSFEREELPLVRKIGIYGDSILRSTYEILTTEFNEADFSVELISEGDEFILVLASVNESLLYFEAFELATEILRSQQ